MCVCLTYAYVRISCVQVELRLEPDAVAAGGLSYLPGDALGIWPSNPPQVRYGEFAAVGSGQCKHEG